MRRAPLPSAVALATLPLLLVLACGRNDDATDRYNRVLGKTPAGAPTGPALTDPALRADPAGYQPAAYPGSVAAGPAGGGLEEQAIRGLVRDATKALIALDAAAFLDALDPDGFAEIVALKSQLIELVEKVEQFERVLRAKASPEMAEQTAASDALKERMLAELPGLVASAVVVEIVSPQRAVITADPAALSEALGPLLETAGAMGGEGSPASAVSAAGILAQISAMPAPALPLRKVDDSWRFATPLPLPPGVGDLAREGLELARGALDGIMAKLDGVEQIDPTVLAGVTMQTMAEMMPAVMSITEKLQTLIGGAGPPPDDGASGRGSPRGEPPPEEDESDRPAIRP